jgi:CelD/BcsL family acetyltransferase involved in cellulose biosynthesis
LVQHDIDVKPADIDKPRFRIVSERSEIAACLIDAEPLLDAVGAPFCARALWLSAWYEQARSRPVVLLVEAMGVPVAMACLAVQRAGPVRTIRLAGHGPSDYGRLPARDPVAAAALAAGIVDWLGGLRGPWRLDLAQLPVGDPVAGRLLTALSGARLEPDQSSPVLTFAEGQDRHERFFTARILREVRRGQRKLDQAGVAAQVRRISSPVGVHRLLPDVVAMRRARDHTVGRRSHLDGRRARSFYVNAVQALTDAGQAEIWTLNVEGTLGAYFVGVRDGSSYRILDGRMSTQWGSASLALLLRAALIGELLSEPGIKEVDYMRGVLHHKMQDASRVVPAERLMAESSTRVATLARQWSALRRSLARRVPVQTRRWILSLVRVGGGSSRSSRAAPAEAQEVPPRPGA